MDFTLSGLTEVLLSWLLIYGPRMLLVLLFLCAVGFPVPGTFLVLATGAFVRQGIFALEIVALCAWCGAVAGDCISYGMGRFARGFTQRRFGHTVAWRQAETHFHQRSGIAIYLTRWLFTPLAIPVNLVAGGTGYPARKFLLYDGAGEATWLLVYGSLGYLFSSYWEEISLLVNNFSGVLAGIVIVSLGLYILFRTQTVRRKRSRDKIGHSTVEAAISERAVVETAVVETAVEEHMNHEETHGFCTH